MKSNKLRNFMVMVSVLITVVLAVVLANFIRSNGAEIYTEQEPQPLLKVLAPFGLVAHRQALEEVVADYCALPGKPLVELQYIPQEVYQKEISMRLDQGKLADLIICENVIMPALIGMGVYSDITGYISEGRYEQDFYSPLWYNTRSNGRIYGMPFTCDPLVLFYNKQMLARKNLSAPKNWEELEYVAFHVQAPGNYGFGIAPKQPEETASLFTQMLYSTGSSIREINNQDGLRLFDMLYHLKSQRMLSGDTVNWSLLDLSEAFMGGQVAMMAGSVSTASAIKNRSLNFEVGIAALPSDKQEIYMFHGKNIGVTTTADVNRAMDLLEYLSSKEAVRKISYSMDTIPVRVDVNYDNTGKDIAMEHSFVEKQLDSGIVKSSFGTWFIISSAISDGMHRIFGSAAISSEELADDMQDKIRVAIIDQ